MSVECSYCLSFQKLCVLPGDTLPGDVLLGDVFSSLPGKLVVLVTLAGESFFAGDTFFPGEVLLAGDLAGDAFFAEEALLDDEMLFAEEVLLTGDTFFADEALLVEEVLFADEVFLIDELLFPEEVFFTVAFFEGVFLLVVFFFGDVDFLTPAPVFFLAGARGFEVLASVFLGAAALACSSCLMRVLRRTVGAILDGELVQFLSSILDDVPLSTVSVISFNTRRHATRRVYPFSDNQKERVIVPCLLLPSSKLVVVMDQKAARRT